MIPAILTLKQLPNLSALHHKQINFHKCKVSATLVFVQEMYLTEVIADFKGFNSSLEVAMACRPYGPALQ